MPNKSVQAQSLENNTAEPLKSEGFEEIRVLREGNTVICTIEKGLYRTPAEDFRHALLQLNSIYPDSCQFRIILLEQGQPLYQIIVEKTGRKDKLPGETNLDEPQFKGEISYYDEKTWHKIKKEPVHRPVHTGLTLTIYPQITFRNIFLDGPIYEKQFNLAPVIQYSGWQGMMLTGQLIFPLVNELNKADNYIRPGFMTFSQNFSLPGWNSLRFTIGNFNKNSYGLDLSWKKRFQHSRWNIGANVGLTGRSYINDWYWNHSPLNRFSWSVKAGYYLPSLHIQADIQAGQFLANDKGVRADLYRHFGEVTIGVYAGYAGGRTNGGFHFAIPLDPFKRKHKSRFRILLPASFDNEYNASNEFVYGRYYETRPDENRSVQDLPPQFINSIFFNP
jgi:hypothetical protein